MTTAKFQVVHAGPLVSIQDGGRHGYMRFGVTPSGPMDRRSHATANVSLGNLKHNTSIEISPGGLILKCESGSLTFAVAGGSFLVECNDRVTSSVVSTIEAGQTLSIRPGKSGSWCYLAFAGEMDAHTWLGQTATNALTGLGGGMLTTGQVLTIANCRVAKDREGDIPPFNTSNATGTCRVVMGPQDQHFSTNVKQRLLQSVFTLSNAYDRMGVRLEGGSLAPDGALSIPSGPVSKGSIQVAGDGVPTVLLADHQPTGGYPKIATLASADFDDFVQLRAGDSVRFKAITPAAALQAVRKHAVLLDLYFADIAQPKGTLEHRLQNNNLISGVVAETDLNAHSNTQI